MAYAIIGIVFLLLIVFVVLSAKTWHWVNIVFLILTFIAGVAATAGLSQVMKMRTDQMRDAETSLERRENIEKQANEAVHGPIDAVEYDRNSLRGINELLNRELAGQGRIWASGDVSANGENRVFKFAVARAGGQDNEMQDMVLYAFADGTVDGQSLPKTFVGTVRVVSESDQQVELEPIFVADTQEFSQPQTSWSLFEKMPGDRRGILLKAENLVRENDFDVDAYRTLLTDKYFVQEDYVKTDPAQNQAAYDKELKYYTHLVDRYAFDGMSLGEIQQWLTSHNRPQDDFAIELQEEFVRFKFDHRSEPISVDASTGNLDTDGPFTKRGLAVDPALHKGDDGKVTFQKDDEVLIDRRTAEGYQLPDGTQVAAFSSKKTASGQDMVQEIGRYYIRQLKDFPYELSDLKRQTERFVIETARVKANTVVTEASLADANQQVSERDEIIRRLDEDNQNLKNDFQIINDLHDQRAQELRELAERARVLQLEIRQRYAEIMQALKAITSPEKVASK